MMRADQRWNTCSFSCEVLVMIPIQLTLVANALGDRGVSVGKKQRVEGTDIMKGIIAIEIHPARVAMGGLCPISSFGQ